MIQNIKENKILKNLEVPLTNSKRTIEYNVVHLIVVNHLSRTRRKGKLD